MEPNSLIFTLILKSSKDCYHVVCNRAVSWAKNLKIVAWVALLSQNRGLIKWLLMQCIKQSSTLRISPKREKPSPRIVFRQGKQDQQIENFLRMRTLTKKIIKKYEKTVFSLFLNRYSQKIGHNRTVLNQYKPILKHHNGIQ